MRYILILLISFFCCQISFAQFQIGQRTITFNDPGRSGGFGSGGGPGRQIQTEIYYPATQSSSNAPFADGSFPLITFGHGFVMTWSAYQNIWQELVPKGYIIAFPRTEGNFSVSHGDFGLDLALVNERIRALNFNETSPFFGKVEQKSAIAGHSMGGGAAWLAAANNLNVDALIGFAPANTSPSAQAAGANINVPVLILSGSADGVTPPNEHHLPIFNTTASDCKTFISITGGAHCYFANSNFNCDFGEATSSFGISLSRTQQQQITFEFIVPWLDFILKNNCEQYALYESRLQNDNIINAINQCDLPQPNFSITGTPSFCEGDSISLISGLSEGFIWSNGDLDSVISISDAGVYFLLNQQNCQVSDSIEVIVFPNPQAPLLSLNGSLSICEGDSIQLTASGDGQIIWNTGIESDTLSLMLAGDYNAFVRNNQGCESDPSETFALTVLDIPPVPILNYSGLLTICPSETITVTAAATTFNIVWSTSEIGSAFEVNIPGVYYAIANNEGICFSDTSASFEIQHHNVMIPEISLLDENTLQCSPASFYQWILNGNFIPGANAQVLDMNQNGTYQAETLDSNNCPSISDIYQYLQTQTENIGSNEFKVYPNPASHTLHVKLKKHYTGKLFIYDTKGRILLEQECFSTNNVLLSVEQLKPGTYFLIIGRYSEKFVVD